MTKLKNNFATIFFFIVVAFFLMSATSFANEDDSLTAQSKNVESNMIDESTTDSELSVEEEPTQVIDDEESSIFSEE